MRRFLILAAAFLQLRSAAAASIDAPIVGRWLTDDRKAVVTITRCGETFCGKVTTVLDRGPDVPATDIMNPDGGLRNRPILGLPVLSGFRWRGGSWRGGRAYDPKTGSTYRAELAINPDGSLKVTGCVLFFCQSKHWTRQP